MKVIGYDRRIILELLWRVQIVQKYRLKSHNTEMGMIHMPFTVPDRPVLIELTPRVPQEDAGRRLEDAGRPPCRSI